MKTYRTLDTFEAELLNDPRRETVTEIQSEEDGETLCYAFPHNAELIVRALNSFEAMRAALTSLGDLDRIAQALVNVIGPVSAADWRDKAKTALALSEGKESEVGK